MNEKKRNKVFSGHNYILDDLLQALLAFWWITANES